MEAVNKTSGITLRCPETIIECPLCMERFESPRILPCQHTFCKECLTKLIRKSCLDSNGGVTKRSFPCPICRRECKLFKREGVVSMHEHLKGFPEHRLIVNLINDNDERHILNNNAAKKVETESQTEGQLNETNPDNEDNEYIIHKTLCHYYLLLYTIYGYLRHCVNLQTMFVWNQTASRNIFLNPRVNATFALNLRYAICFLRRFSLPLIFPKETIPLDVLPKPTDFFKLKMKNKWLHVEQLHYILDNLIDSSGLIHAINSKWHDQIRSKMANYQLYENTRDVATQTEQTKTILVMISTFIGRFCLFILSHLLFIRGFSIVETFGCMIRGKLHISAIVNNTWMDNKIFFMLRSCVVCFIIYWYELIQNWLVIIVLCVLVYIVMWLMVSPFLKEWELLFIKDFAFATIPIQNSFQTVQRVVHTMCFVENALRFYVITHSSNILYEQLINILLVDLIYFICFVISNVIVVVFFSTYVQYIYIPHQE